MPNSFFSAIILTYCVSLYCHLQEAPDFASGIHLGEGFDFRTESHLVQLFGFANICANWDYSPSREFTAMVYPLFEYSLLVYLVLDFVQTKLSYKRGELTEWFYAFSKIVFPINIFLCAQFRMIFVCIAYENVSQHTAGFLGLQISLVLVALQNTIYVIDSNVSYDFLGGITNTRLVAIAYLIGLCSISFVKVQATIFVVMNGRGAPWTLEPAAIGDQVVGQLVDKVWMIFNAVLPLVISYVRSKNEYPLDIVITSDEPNYVEKGQEMKPLNKSGGGGGLKYESSVQEVI